MREGFCANGKLGDALASGWKAPLYRNAVYIMLSNVVGAGGGFLFYSIVARLYTPGNLGYAQTLYNAVSFLATFAILGLGNALVRFLPGAGDKAKTLNTSLTLAGLAAISLAAVFVLGVNVWFPSLGFILSPAYGAAIVFATLAAALAHVFDSAGYAMRRADLILWRNVIFTALKIPMAAAFALFAATSGRFGIFLAIALPFAIGTAFQGAFFMPRVIRGYRPRPSLGLSHIRPMLRFSAGNYAANTIGAMDSLLFLPLIIVVLGASPGPAQAAFFFVAVLIAGLPGVISTSIFTSLFAEASQGNAGPEERRANERGAILLTTALLLPVMVVMWLLARFALHIFAGTVYENGSLGSLRILILGLVPGFLNNILGTRIQIQKRTRPLVASMVVSTAVSLGLGYFLLRQWGIEGLAAASVIGPAAQTLYLYSAAGKGRPPRRDGRGPGH